ncbi:MAG TPA: FtsX-like permease family protein, partial [Gemmatimonadaceae bacterium]
IACANVANLLAVRAMQRRREIAVRLALGISRLRLIAQLMTESLVLSILGGAAALGVAHWGGQLVRSQLLSRYAWDGSPVDGRLLAFTAVVSVIVGLVCALLPAYQSGRADVSHALKHGASDGANSRSRARSALLITQAALAVVLLVGAVLFTRSLRNINAIELGMQTKNVIVGTTDLSGVGFTPEQSTAAFEEMERRVKAMPGIQAVAVGTMLPFNSSHATYFRIPGHDSIPDTGDGGPYVNAVTPDFFSATGIKILRGRGFTETDRATQSRVVVVSESMARLIWKNENPIGQCVFVSADSLPCHQIVGVAANTHRNGVLEHSEVLQYYIQLAYEDASIENRILFVRPTDGNAGRWADPVRRMMQSALPNLPYANVRPMRSLYSNEVRPWELGATMFGLFGALALVLTGVGLYSVVAYATAQRRHEMGVRIALGARSSDIADLVVAQGVRVTIAGIFAGIVITLASGRFVATLLFGVTARDLPTMIGVGVAVLAVALAASMIPAWRATRADPVASLRAD